MGQTQSRRGFFAALLGGVAIIWIASNKVQQGTSSFVVPQLGLQEAKGLIDAGAIVLDVREEEGFQHRHLPVAVLLPLEVLRVAIPAWLTAAKEKQIVVYCGDGVTHGPEATHLLVQAGFSHAANLTAGIQGWDSAGLPLQRG